MKSSVVWEYVETARATGGKQVKVKWVHDQRANGVVRARLVAMEIAYDLRGDTFAGTPGLVVVRYLVSRAATGSRGRQLAVHDVSCTFFACWS